MTMGLEIDANNNEHDLLAGLDIGSDANLTDSCETSELWSRRRINR